MQDCSVPELPYSRFFPAVSGWWGLRGAVNTTVCWLIVVAACVVSHPLGQHPPAALFWAAAAPRRLVETGSMPQRRAAASPEAQRAAFVPPLTRG